MKKFLLSFTLLASPLALAEKIEIGVQGMVCSFCAQGIQKSFKKDAAVTKIDVNIEGKRVNLETKAKGDLSDDKIKTIIKDAGYETVSIKRL